MSWFSWARKAVKQKTCVHNRDGSMGELQLGFGEFKVLQVVPVGVSLGWSFRPELFKRSQIHCLKCGAIYWREPRYSPGKLDPVARDAAGWPVDEAGVKYPVLDDRAKAAGIPVREG